MKIKIESEIEVDINLIKSFVNKEVYKGESDIDIDYVINQISSLFSKMIQNVLLAKMKELAKSKEENSIYPWLEHHLETDIYLAELINNNLKISK